MNKRRYTRTARRADGASAFAAESMRELADASEDDPLEFSLRVMRDETQPMALRASMAKAAMAAMKGRESDGGDSGSTPAGPPDPYSDRHPSSLELARRIAVIFHRADEELRAAELAAEGWDVKTRGMPVDNTDWARIMGRLLAILGSCHSPIESLDRAGIRF